MKGFSPVELIRSAAEPDDFPQQSLPEVAVVGRSNVGKSSLLNRLTGVKRLAFVSKTPGRTQLINFFRLGGEMVLVDLPGYGFAKAPISVRTKWERLVTSYLFDRACLVLVLLLVDIRRDPVESDLRVRDLMEEREIDYVVVATKSDKLSGGKLRQQRERLREVYGAGEKVPVVTFSAVTSEGRKELWKVIEKRVREARRAPKS
jgi:GTP-binding protein